MTASTNPPAGGGKNAFERLLTVFTDVQPGEGRAALLLALSVFLILAGYYIIKPVREAWILSGPGAEVKSYASAVQAVLLAAVFVPLYSMLASRLPRMKLLNGVNAFFVINLVLFWLASLVWTSPVLDVSFYMWVGIFNLMVPAQAWSFANGYYAETQGKRLFVLVAFGASAGAVLGSKIADWLIEPLGLANMLLVSAGFLVVANAIILYVSRIPNPAKIREDEESGQVDDAEQGFGKDGAFALVMRNRYLLLMAFLLLMLNWVNTNGEYILGRAVSEDVTKQYEALAVAGEAVTDQETFEKDSIGNFYAQFFFVVNILGLAAQLFLVSRVIQRFGLRGSLLILPIISMSAYMLLFLFPGKIQLIRWSKTVENSTDYSLQNTVRQALFLPTTAEEKYKAKQAIDTFFVRAGDVLSAGVVFVGASVLHLALRAFALVNVGLVVGWLILAVALGREYRRITRDRREAASAGPG